MSLVLAAFKVTQAIHIWSILPGSSSILPILKRLFLGQVPVKKPNEKPATKRPSGLHSSKNNPNTHKHTHAILNSQWCKYENEDISAVLEAVSFLGPPSSGFFFIFLPTIQPPPPLWRSAAHKTKWGVCNLARRLLADLCSSILATAGGKGAGGEQKRRLAPGSLHHRPAPTYHCISHLYCLHRAINVSGAPFKVHLHSGPNPIDLIHVSTIVLPPGSLGPHNLLQ